MNKTRRLLSLTLVFFLFFPLLFADEDLAAQSNTRTIILKPFFATVDQDELKLLIESKVDELKVRRDDAYNEKESIRKKLNLAKAFLFIGGGGGGGIATVSAFISDDSFPQEIGGVAGIISVACIFIPGVIGLDKDELSAKMNEHNKFILQINSWITVFEGYLIDLTFEVTPEELDGIKNSVRDAQTEIDVLDPLLNIEN